MQATRRSTAENGEMSIPFPQSVPSATPSAPGATYAPAENASPGQWRREVTAPPTWNSALPNPSRNPFALSYGIQGRYRLTDRFHLLAAGFIDDEKIRANVVKYFSSFDETIKGFEVTKLPAQEDSKEEKYLIDALHKKIGSEDMAKIPLAHESAGTLKMFALYPELQDF